MRTDCFSYAEIKRGARHMAALAGRDEGGIDWQIMRSIDS